MVQGGDTNERIGGIRALDALIDFKGDDAGQKTTRFASHLRAVMRGNDTTAMIFAARALGRLATPGATLTAELVDAEVQTALEYLQTDRQENRRFAAVLIIRELARHASTLLYQWMPQIFQVIWSALRDPKVLIRETAAEAVSACFEIVAPRDSQMRQSFFGKVYEEILQGFRLNTVDSIHGSLLTLKELLQKGGMFMHGQNKYKDACEVVLRYKDHRDSLIRREVVSTIPILAAYAPNEFKATYLPQCIDYLMNLMNKDKERSIAFLAAGKVANAMGNGIAPYLEPLLAQIREALKLKSYLRAPFPFHLELI